MFLDFSFVDLCLSDLRRRSVHQRSEQSASSHRRTFSSICFLQSSLKSCSFTLSTKLDAQFNSSLLQILSNQTLPIVFAAPTSSIDVSFVFYFSLAFVNICSLKILHSARRIASVRLVRCQYAMPNDRSPSPERFGRSIEFRPAFRFVRSLEEKFSSMEIRFFSLSNRSLYDRFGSILCFYLDLFPNICRCFVLSVRADSRDDARPAVRSVHPSRSDATSDVERFLRVRVSAHVDVEQQRSDRVE